eukprot:31226-Prymnesium_polylepis.1
MECVVVVVVVEFNVVCLWRRRASCQLVVIEACDSGGCVFRRMKQRYAGGLVVDDCKPCPDGDAALGYGEKQKRKRRPQNPHGCGACSHYADDRATTFAVRRRRDVHKERVDAGEDECANHAFRRTEEANRLAEWALHRHGGGGEEGDDKQGHGREQKWR